MPFYTNSTQYKEFVELCEKRQWKELPREANDKELKAFMDKGDNINPFSRLQVQTKFRQWKVSDDAKALDDELRFVVPEQLPQSKALLLSVKTTQFYSIVTRHTDLDLFVEEHENSILELIQVLRSDSIQSINDALGNALAPDVRNKSRVYHDSKKETRRSLQIHSMRLSSRRMRRFANNSLYPLVECSPWRFFARFISSSCHEMVRRWKVSC